MRDGLVPGGVRPREAREARVNLERPSEWAPACSLDRHVLPELRAEVCSRAGARLPESREGGL